ncbi:MAG: Uma2 family endonuclease [Ruminococcus sp.]|nr:Uma2 family endonuclease [Ruminococcus sp.]
MPSALCSKECFAFFRAVSNFLDSPRLVLEVLSPTTEQYDRTGKMEIYRQQEIEEYWIVDWRKKEIEIYELDYESGCPKYYLWNKITENNDYSNAV